MKLDRYYALGGGPAAAAVVVGGQAGVAAQELLTERAKLGKQLQEVEKHRKLQRWQPDSTDYKEVLSELKAYHLRRQQDSAEALACLVASYRDRLHKADAITRRERHKMRVRLSAQVDRLCSALREVRRWLLAPGNFTTPGWGVAEVDAALGQVMRQHGRREGAAGEPADAAEANQLSEGGVSQDGLLELPWLENPSALWHVAEPVHLQEVHKRCGEELTILCREADDMVERFELSVRGLQEVCSTLEGHLQELSSALTAWDEEVAPIHRADAAALQVSR
jgi:hypothetical protein